MKIKTLAPWATFIAALAIPFAASGDDRMKPTDPELQVVAHFHQVNLNEIDLGKMAQKKSTNAAVNSYGRMLVKDHMANDSDLKSFVTKYHVTIPKETLASDAEQQQAKDDKDMVNHLQALTGPEFEREFLKMMVDGHTRELTKCDAAINEVANKDLLTLLKTTRPVLQKHADQARALSNNSQAAR